jgi:Tfp pilus assembly protein PilF
VALEDAGKTAEAITAYQAILAAHPEATTAWINLGNAQEKLGQHEEAEASFRKALQIDPASRDALNNLAWLLFEEKRYPEAEPLARKAAAEQGPDSYLVLDTLGRVLAARGACEEAVRTFQKAIDSLSPSQTAARDGLQQTLDQTRSTCKGAIP